MVNMASDLDRGRVRPTTTATKNDVLQHGGNTPASRSTKLCSLVLQRTSLILEIHVMLTSIT